MAFLAQAFRALPARAARSAPARRSLLIPQPQRLPRFPARASWRAFSGTSFRADAGASTTVVDDYVEEEEAPPRRTSASGHYPDIDNSWIPTGDGEKGGGAKVYGAALRYPRGFIRRVLPHPLSRKRGPVANAAEHVGNEYFGKTLKTKAMPTHAFSRLVKGVGPKRAREIDEMFGFPRGLRLTELHPDELTALVHYVEGKLPYPTGRKLDKMVNQDIRDLIANGSYRGRRHRVGLPARGQRTRSNARTAKNKGPMRFDDKTDLSEQRWKHMKKKSGLEGRALAEATHQHYLKKARDEAGDEVDDWFDDEEEEYDTDDDEDWDSDDDSDEDWDSDDEEDSDSDSDEDSDSDSDGDDSDSDSDEDDSDSDDE